jgi:fatty-acyl-CoA synthase
MSIGGGGSDGVTPSMSLGLEPSILMALLGVERVAPFSQEESADRGASSNAADCISHLRSAILDHMIESTMQDYPLTIQALLAHGRRVYAASEVLTYDGPGNIRTTTFAEVADRADKLAAALSHLGIDRGDRVGTFMWNNQRHLEAYFAVPAMGAVLHTLNIRLFPEQLAYVINHGEGRIIIVDGSIAPLLARVRDQLTTVEVIITTGEGDFSGLGKTLDYEELLAAESAGFDYPELDERSAAAMCYTSGTTGNPKGVTYSHRSTYLHSFGAVAAGALGLRESERILVIVPQFHANAWGIPYAAFMAGADMVMPQQHLQANALAEIIEATRPTMSAAVPTVLNDLLANAPDADLSSLRFVVCGGAPVPRSLIEGYRATFGVDILQGWGMTETSPLAALAWPPRRSDPADEVAWRAKTGRVVAGVELRICAEDGAELPWDGAAQGEIEVRGPWITASYHRDPSSETFHDGWLRTGDVGSVEPNGFVMISDRAKDVIKSGGEWISSVDLENTLMGHPAVREAAVIGVPDERWDERPLACIVLGADQSAAAAELRDYLEGKVARWWLPERWSFIDEIPKTSVGKFNKKVLRQRLTDGGMNVEVLS